MYIYKAEVVTFLGCFIGKRALRADPVKANDIVDRPVLGTRRTCVNSLALQTNCTSITRVALTWHGHCPIFGCFDMQNHCSRKCSLIREYYIWYRDIYICLLRMGPMCLPLSSNPNHRKRSRSFKLTTKALEMIRLNNFADTFRAFHHQKQIIINVLRLVHLYRISISNHRKG